MRILSGVKLAPYTTFKIGGPARFFCRVKSEEDLSKAIRFAKEKGLPVLVIGGGSNLLVSDAGFKGLVIRNEILGTRFVVLRKDIEKAGGPDADSGKVWVEACAGEDWDDLVKDTVKRGLYGLENLSSIPGKVGAAPVQNIGAYGTEAAKTIVAVRALDTESMQFVELDNAACAFAYRDSLFKHQKGRYVISRVTFELAKHGQVDISYRDLTQYFAAKLDQDGKTPGPNKASGKAQGEDSVGRNPPGPTLKQARQAVIEIRNNKLPDSRSWGTAGSFFKNPIIEADHFLKLKTRYPELPGFREPDGRVKVSLGWILDKTCQARGLMVGNVGTYEKQALVLIARPGATAKEVMAFAHELAGRVKAQTGIQIEPEVEWVAGASAQDHRSADW